MKHAVVSLLLCACLIGCESSKNPFADPVTVDDGTDTGTDTGGGGGTTTGGGGSINTDTTVTVPTAIAGNVSSVTFDATAGTLVVEGVNLDNVPVSTTYNRAPALDSNGFLAFTVQDDPIDRHFTAYAGESGNVRAGVVSSPGPRNRSFLGADFERTGRFDPPEVSTTSGQVTYAGTYVGLTNVGDTNGSDLLSTSVTPTELQPSQALIINGEALLNADFADNSVEGNILNRQLLDTDLNTLNDLPSLVLVVTSIDSNGTFAGSVEYDNRDPLSNTDNNTGVGTYAGVFAGTDSTEVAGAIQLEEFDGVGDPLGFDAELESGVFILDQCGVTATSTLCNLIP